MATLNATESKARDMIEQSRAADANGTLPANWSQRQIVRRVFEAMYANALTVEQITRIGAAIESLQECPELTAGMQKALTSLVRDKLLRTRRDQGRKLYELNY